MNVTYLRFPVHRDDNGVLCVYETAQHVPFCIERVFTVFANEGSKRGEHAHKRCSQLLICLSGSIKVTCDNGEVKSSYILNDMSMGLMVPPRIWAKEEYLTNNAVLMVLCDQIYESDDYIRNYEDFKSFVG